MVGNASRVAWESFSSMTICCVLASPEGNGGEIVDVEVGRGVDLSLCEGVGIPVLVRARRRASRLDVPSMRTVDFSMNTLR